MYEGRYDEAIAILPAAAKRDQDQQNILGAASKLVALAEAYQARGNDAGAADGDRAGARPVNAGERARARGAARHRRGTSRGGAQDRRGARAAPVRPEPRLREDDRRGNRDRREAIRRRPSMRSTPRRSRRTCGSSASRWASPTSIMAIIPKPSRNSRSAASGAARRRRCSSTTCRPFHYYATAALLARARARDAEARRALAVPGVPAHPPGRDRRSARRGRAAPDRIRRALIFLWVPPRPRTIGERCASAGDRHRHRPGGSRDDSRDGRDDGRDSGSERIEFDASTRHRRRRRR